MSTPFSFLKEIKSSEIITPALPIHPILDQLNGVLVIGKDGRTYRNGGAYPNNAIVGGNNTQKSGTITFQIAHMLWRIEEAIAFFIDIEATYSVERLAELYDSICGIKGEFMANVLNKRFFYFSRNDGWDGTKTHDFFKEMNAKVREELKTKKDAYIETPFLDSEGKPMKMIIPLIVAVDSVSEMHFERTSAEFQEGDVDEGGKKRTRDMVIGNNRRIVYEDADALGGPIGMVQLWTAQVVDTINMTGRPEEKESVFIRQGKKIKGPKSLMRIPQWGLEVIRGTVLKSGQEWMYPNPFGRDIFIDKDARENPDLMLYPLTCYRNKSGSSGGSFFFIASQSLGIQPGLTMFHALKSANMFGLEGSTQRQTCVLYPELSVQRTTVWEKTLIDEKFVRALAICYDLLDMANDPSIDNKYRINPTELYNLIIEQGLNWNDILEHTVDYWFTNKRINKHTLSTMELVKVALGERKAYWVPETPKEETKTTKADKK